MKIKLYKDFILERSSLTLLGVPKEAMQHIQYEYEISSDAHWQRIKKDKDFDSELKKYEKTLYIQVMVRKIRVILNNFNDYSIQDITYDDSGWGGYKVKKREKMSRTQIHQRITAKDLLFKLTSGDFKTKEKTKRLIQKDIKHFDKITNEFKMYILKNFNKIIKKIYGGKYNKIMDQIVKNIETMTPGLNKEDLMAFLQYNKKFAKIANEYEDAKDEEDILRITDLEEQYNSLTVLDEFLINFEDGYSEKFSTRLTIRDLIKDFGLMKIETAFMYYLYTGNLKDLNIQLEKCNIY